MKKFVQCVVMSAVVSAMLSIVPAQAADPAAPRIPSSYPVANMTRVCVDRDSRELSWVATAGCAKGAKRVDLGVSQRLAVCSTGDRVLLVGKGACARRRGSFNRIPDSAPVFFCASRAQRGALRELDRPSRCRDSERALRSRDLAPDDVTLEDASVPENASIGLAVGALVASDPDAGDRHTFALVPGAGSSDNTAFSIEGGVLRTAAALDAESRTTYRVRVQATDLLGRSVARRLSVTVTDLVENVAPTDVGLVPATVPENQAPGTVVGMLRTVDADAGDTHTYTLVGTPGTSDETTSFEVAGSTLRTRARLDFEAGATRVVGVRSTDGAGASVTRSLTVAVTDVNDAPSAVVLTPATVPENDDDALVGTLATTDQDSGDIFTYDLVAGTGDSDNLLFGVTGDQLSTVQALDLETRAAYSVRVRTTDAAGASHEQVLTVTATDVNDAPTAVRLSPASVAENRQVATVVGTLSADDQDTGDTHTYTLVGGAADNAAFAVSAGRLVTQRMFDYEAQATYDVVLRGTDADGESVDSTLRVTVTNVNDGPTAVDLSRTTVAENAAVPSVVGRLSTTDQDGDDVHTYTLAPGGADNADFTVVGDELRSARSFDFESETSYDVRVRSSDAGGEVVERDFAIAVTDVNEAPFSLSLSPSGVPENSPSGTSVGRLTGQDPDAGSTLTYALIGGDTSDFAVVGDELRTTASFDRETRQSYAVTVRVTDGGTPGLTFEESLTVTVTDVNETATEITLAPAAVAENRPASTAVGVLGANDPDAGQTLTFAMVPGAGDDDNALFTVADATLVTTRPLDRETEGSSFSVRVRVSDGSAVTFAETLTVTLDDVNDAPTALAVSDGQVLENQPSGTVVGELSTTDQDFGDTHTYSLVAGDGDADNDSFSVVGAELRTVDVLDRETKASYTVRVQTDDGRGGIFSRAIAVSVDNVNESPTGIALSAATLPENRTTYDVGTLSAVDPDSVSPYTFALVAGGEPNDNDGFTVDGTTLRSTTPADFETEPIRTVRVRVTDAGGAAFSADLVITVLDGNDAPEGVTLTPATTTENAPVGTSIGVLGTSDEPSDRATFTLVTGSGDTDNALVSVDEGVLQTAGVIDFETTPALRVRVRVTDSEGLFDEQAVDITVTDANEAPSGLALSSTTVAENRSSGTLVGGFSVTDPDADDTVAYQLIGGSGATHNTAFTVTDDQLFTAASFDRETQPTRSVRVRATDRSGATTEQAFTITVTDVNESPSAPTLVGDTVVENAPVGTVVGTLGSSDPDADDTATYSLAAGGADNTSFQIDATTRELKTAAPLDFEAGATRQVRIAVTDRGGLSTEAAVIVNVTDVNEAPVVRGDSFTGAVGNTQAKAGAASPTGPTVTLAGTLPLANDTDPESNPLSVVPRTVTTTEGGTATTLADGSFSYVPQAGDRGLLDTFTYSVTDGALASNGTITIAIGARAIWWVKAGATVPGTGTSVSPYPGFDPLQTTSDPDLPGDEIFAYAGSYATIALEADQKLAGEGIGLAGLVPAGTRPLLTGVALANGVVVDGLNVAATTAPAVSASAVGSATVGTSVGLSSTTSDAVRIEGGAGVIVVGAPIATTTTAGRGVHVEGRTGGSVSVTAAISTTGRGVTLNGNAGTVRFSGPIDARGGVVVSGSASGAAVDFTGRVSSTGTGVQLTSNTGAGITFSGGVSLSTGAQNGFVATGGGTVSVTGAENTLATTTGSPLVVSGTAIGAGRLTFRSISSNGAPSGIRLENTGAAGGLVVTGSPGGLCGGSVTADGTTTSPAVAADCTGGTITGSTGPGIKLLSTLAPSLSRVRIAGGGDDGIQAGEVAGGLTLAASLVENNGNAAGEDGVALGDSTLGSTQGGTGTFAVSDSTVRGSGDINVFVGNRTGAAALQLTESQVSGAGRATGAGTRDGVLTLATGTGDLTTTVTGSRLTDNLGDHVQVSSSSAGTTTASVTGNVLSGTDQAVVGGGIVVSASGAPWNGTMDSTVSSNTVLGARASAIVVSETNGSGARFSARVTSNMVGNATANSCSTNGDGISVANDGGSGLMRLLIEGNTLTSCARRGVAVVAGDGNAAVSATVRSNVVSNLSSTTGTHAVQLRIGFVAGDAGVSCLDVRQNTLSPASTPGSPAALRLSHSYGLIRLPGYPGAATDQTAVRSFLATANPATATVAVDGASTGTFENNPGTCALPA